MTQTLVIDTSTTPLRVTVNKGETFRLLFPVLDDTGPRSAIGFAAAAVVKEYGSSTVLASWSTAAATAQCTVDGVILLFDGNLTAAWTWDHGQFELDISAGGNPSRLGEGPFVAKPQLVPLPIT